MTSSHIVVKSFSRSPSPAHGMEEDLNVGSVNNNYLWVFEASKNIKCVKVSSFGSAVASFRRLVVSLVACGSVPISNVPTADRTANAATLVAAEPRPATPKQKVSTCCEHNRPLG